MSSARILVTPPTAAVITVYAAKSRLRVDDGDNDPVIEAMIATAVSRLDPAAGGWFRRALRPQTWELRLSGFWERDCFDSSYGPEAIVLPYPPLISVDSVKYDDSDGVEQTLVEGSGFRVFGIGAPLAKAAIAPLYNQTWPSARCDRESVRIRFTCGYPVAVAADPDHDPPVAEVIDRLPPPIVQYLMLYVGSLYENRESVVGGGDDAVELPAHIMEMISNLQPYG